MADIDLPAITANVRAVREIVGPGCAVAAVVKASGYGLGAAWVARAALDGGASWLAVAMVDEGVQLREAGFDCPILVMGYSAPWEALAIVAHRLTPAVHRPATVTALQEAASGLAGTDRIAVHIKVDTGLGRYGCTPVECLPLARLVAASPRLHLEGLMTHFAEADAEDLSFTREQLAVLKRLLEDARAEGIEFPMAHASGSAGLLALPDARLDLVRVGIMLSGQYPSRRLKQHISLRPALSLRANLARMFEVRQGESAGYGRTWRAERPTPVGLVPVGYADGYMRAISNRGAMLVRGRRCPVVGRVSMDQITIDLSAAQGAQEGDEVVLIGRQGDEEITVDEVAEWAGTISYEVLTGLSPRVPRRYLRDGLVVGTCDLLGCE